MTSNSWNGLVGMVVDNEIDMIAADLTITSQRHEVLEFSVPFLSAHLTVLLKKERRRRERHGRASIGVRKSFLIIVTFYYLYFQAYRDSTFC